MANVSVRLRGRGSANEAIVTPDGRLVVGQLSYDDTQFNSLTGTGAFNFYKPRTGFRFVIKGLNIRAAQSVSNSFDATVVIYEASELTGTVIDKTLWQEGMVRAAHTGLSGLNILVNEGKWVNAKTTDPTVNMLIMGYYVRIPAASLNPQTSTDF